MDSLNTGPVLAAPVPPPKPLPFLQYLRAAQHNYISAFHEDVYKQGIVESKFVTLRTYIVNEPAGVKHVLLDNESNYVKAAIEHRILGAALGNGLITSEGDTWRTHRRMMAPFFDHRSVQIYAPVMTDAADQLRARWTSKPDGAVIDVADDMMHLTLEIISRCMFSSDSDGIAEVVGESSERYQNSMMLSLLDFLPGLNRAWGKYKTAQGKRILRDVDAIIYRLISSRSQQNSALTHDDLLQQLVSSQDAETGSRMSATDVRDQIFTIFMAGHETTSLALMWTWYLLSQHPAEEEKLYEELAKVLAGRPPTYADLAYLPYTRMVIQESMRLYPPVHSLAWREALKDDEICGKTIPKGSTVAIVPWVLHRHHSFWIEPDRFLPERFAPHASAKPDRFSYLPFGFGPRVCIGAAFAMTEAMICLATLAQHYRLRLLAGHPVETQSLITLRARYGMKMVLERRMKN